MFSSRDYNNLISKIFPGSIYTTHDYFNEQGVKWTDFKETNTLKLGFNTYPLEGVGGITRYKYLEWDITEERLEEIVLNMGISQRIESRPFGEGLFRSLRIMMVPLEDIARLSAEYAQGIIDGRVEKNPRLHNLRRVVERIDWNLLRSGINPYPGIVYLDTPGERFDAFPDIENTPIMEVS